MTDVFNLIASATKPEQAPAPSMTEEQIKEKSMESEDDVSGSALIAEFMKDEQCTSYWVNLRAGVQREYCTTSWNWLMPVLEKICRLKIGDGVETVDYPNLRTFGMINEETGGVMVRFNGFQVFEAETLIEATFLAVVDFLEWWSKANH